MRDELDNDFMMSTPHDFHKANGELHTFPSMYYSPTTFNFKRDWTSIFGLAN